MRNTEEKTCDLDPLLAPTKLQVHCQEAYCDKDQGDFLLQRQNLSRNPTGTSAGSSLSVSSSPAGLLRLDHDNDANHIIKPSSSKRVNSMLGMVYNKAAVSKSPVEHGGKSTSEESHDLEQDASSRKRQRQISTSPTVSCSNQFQMLLTGPPQSGKTSLAMDVAYSIAASSPFPCKRATTVSNDKDDGDPSDDDNDDDDEDPCGSCRRKDSEQDYTCTCTRVAFLTHARNKSAQFPLVCRRRNKGKEEASYFLAAADEALLHPQNASQQSCNEEEVLRRIQVIYLESHKDLIQYLLSIQSLPVHRQPRGGIILDDILSFVQKDHDNDNTADDSVGASSSQQNLHETERVIPNAKELNTTETMKLISILAILSNTGNWLQKRYSLGSHDYNVTLLATMECEENDYLERGCFHSLLPMVIHWMPTLATLQSQQNIETNTKESIVSQWSVNVKHQPRISLEHQDDDSLEPLMGSHSFCVSTVTSSSTFDATHEIKY